MQVDDLGEAEQTTITKKTPGEIGNVIQCKVYLLNATII